MIPCLGQGEAEAEHRKEHLLMFLTMGALGMASVWVQKCPLYHLSGPLPVCVDASQELP